MASGNAAYVERNLVILHEITRATIDAAVRQLARRGFLDLVADDIEEMDRCQVHLGAQARGVSVIRSGDLR